MDRTPTTDLIRCQSAQASGNQPGAGPLVAVDGSPATGWRPTQLIASLNVPLAFQQTISKVTVGWGRQWPPAPAPDVPLPPGPVQTLRAASRAPASFAPPRRRPVVGFESPRRL